MVVLQKVLAIAIQQALSFPLVSPLLGPSVGGDVDLPIRAIFAVPGTLGGVYDPSDLATMIGVGGAQPAAVVGQPVSAILDKRTGLAAGPELIINGGFAGDATGWTLGTPMWTYNAGAISTTVAAAAEYATNTSGPTMTAGACYLVTTTVSGADASNYFTIYDAVARPTVNSNGVKKNYLLSATASKLRLRGVTPTSSVTIDNVSLKLLDTYPHLNYTIGQQPTLRNTSGVYWLDFDGGDDVLTTVFPNLGSSVTIARAVVGVGTTILTGQTISAGNWTDNIDHAGLIIVNRALTGPETAAVTTYLNAKAGVFP